MTTPPAGAESARTIHRGTVLLVDDDANTREVSQLALEGHGYRVLPACHGQEALTTLRTASLPCVAVVDLVMPVMDGWDLISAIRSDSLLAAIHVVVLSGKGREPVQGADQFIEKPFTVDRLLAAVDAFCAGGDAGAS